LGLPAPRGHLAEHDEGVARDLRRLSGGGDPRDPRRQRGRSLWLRRARAPADRRRDRAQGRGDPRRGLSVAEAEPTRRERRRLEVRERILDTALELFEAQGYEATTVAEIVRRADIAYGTFFNHFPSKLHLLRELSDLALRDVFENLEEVRKQPGSF